MVMTAPFNSSRSKQFLDGREFLSLAVGFLLGEDHSVGRHKRAERVMRDASAFSIFPPFHSDPALRPGQQLFEK